MKELRVRFVSGDDGSVHTIYCKQHSVRHPSSLVPNGKTLFTLGWPPFCSREAIAELFSRAGHVTRVFLRDRAGVVEEEEEEEAAVTSSGRFHVAYIVFSDEEEVVNALQLASASSTLPCNVGPVGLVKWCAEYHSQYPDPAGMEAAVEEKIAAYDRQKDAVKSSLKKGLSEPDAEGWITVTRKNPKVFKQDHKKRKKQLVNLYQFQQRETRRQQIADLRKRFLEDKQRVAVMRAQRKFKPFS